MILNTVEDSFEIGCFIYLDSRRTKKEVSPKWWWIKIYWNTNILFKNQVSSSEEGFIYEKRHKIDEIVFSEVSSSSSLRSPTDRCFSNANPFSDFRLITSESPFVKSLLGMVVYKVIKSKAEIYLAFALIEILFNLVTIGK